MSNGSEHIEPGEFRSDLTAHELGYHQRCVHAPDGPDWAGLRELPTPKPDYEALVEGARRRVNDAVPAWGWCMYPTLSRRYLDTPFAEETSWTISEPYCGPGVWCGDGECAGTCGSEAIRTGSEGCEEDWMPAPVAVFVSTAPDDVRALADAVEALLAMEQRLTDHIVQLAAERDALWAQLDSMTVEWHTTRSVSGRGLRRQKRLVSPWTVVEGAPDGQQ